jgi:hypothetical protein
MNIATAATTQEFGHGRGAPAFEHDNSRLSSSAVSWGAILAGAAAAAALSLILLILGIGLGLSSVSPWAYAGVSAATFGMPTILWLTLTQLLASGMGGYLAGRLRTKWVAIHTDEVYFRDTAHGFLAWAVASLATAILLSSAIGSIVRGGASVAGSVATTAAVTAGSAVAGSPMAKPSGEDGSLNYFLDSLFRTGGSTAPNAGGSGPINEANPDRTPGTAAAEIARIFANSIRKGSLPAEDLSYVGQVVAQRTGLTQQQAQQRASDIYARAQANMRDAESAAKDAADKARKASAYAALWLFSSLLIGAFVASLAATYGGRRRDM